MPLGPPIQFARGPWQTMPQLLYGEPAEAYVALPDGTDYELFFLGNRDATSNKLMSGAPTLSGSSPPNFLAPTGAFAYQKTTGNLWVSNGDGSWTQYQKASASGSTGSATSDYGSYWN